MSEAWRTYTRTICDLTPSAISLLVSAFGATRCAELVGLTSDASGREAVRASQAGKGAGFDDERHLWPAWEHLIRICRPPVVFGEQVASKAADSWVAEHQSEQRQRDGRPRRWQPRFADGVIACPVADHAESGREPRGWQPGPSDGCWPARLESGRLRDAGCGLADSSSTGLEVLREQQARRQRETAERGGAASIWDACEFVWCRDGKWRPVEPGTFPPAHGASARVGRLRGYGNAVVSEAAKVWIETYLEAVA